MFLYGELESGYRETPPHSDLYKKGVGGIYFERFRGVFGEDYESGAG